MALLFACAVAVLAAPHIPSVRAETTRIPSDIFGTSSLRSENMKPFPKWRDVIERAAAERTKPRKSCRDSFLVSCKVEEWQSFLRTLEGLPRDIQMRRVNAYLNKAKYILDIVNWKVKDYWATPYQFNDRDGDCEDYAIAKFMSLRKLGFRNDDMRIVVLRDLNLKLAHAILVVRIGGQNYVLDNQIKDAVPARVIRHYKPIYSVNETHWWLHRRQG